MRPTLLPNEDLQNKQADRPWKRSENDRMIDLYLTGSPPTRIAIALKRNPKAIKRRLEQYAYNERGYTEQYKPFRRASRRGKRLTETELHLLRTWQERKVAVKAQACFLQREARELGLDRQALTTLAEMRNVATGVDLVQAHRYIYYVMKAPVISDEAYDNLKAEEMEYGSGSEILIQPASDRVVDYEDRIRNLAIYLAFTYGKKFGGKKLHDSSPSHP